MIDHREAHKVTPGMKLKATGFRGEHSMTYGKVYEAIRVEEGIFESRPFLIVTNDFGEVACWHLSRFSFIDDAAAA
ncbi:hypothetical protein [Sulfitobacter sp. 1A15106]|uniref:hypothetical protein n=1 Tax=Sulfitobacter sp. 1A15106 TaxID=3368590 RepID=UPI003745D887